MYRNYIISITLATLILGCSTSQPSDDSLPSSTCSLDSNVAPTKGDKIYIPPIKSSWQWQLNQPINTSYDVDIYDVDLFNTPQHTIDTLHAQNRRVICYFSAGSYESFREDASKFDESALGKILDGWEDEQWLDICAESIYPIMLERLDLAQAKGCDGVEPDNMDGFANDTGFDLSSSDQLAYNKFIANEAHKRGLSVALKNDLAQIVELEPYFDFALNEECTMYSECFELQPFTTNNKAILHVEYDEKYVTNSNGARDDMCRESIENQFNSLILPLDLDDSFRLSCN